MCTIFHNWVRPSEKMPAPEQRVLVVVKRKVGGNRWRTIAEYIPPFTVLAEDYLDWETDPDFCDVDEQGREYVPEGWYESLLEPDVGYKIDGTVEYWAKLPAIPCG